MGSPLKSRFRSRTPTPTPTPTPEPTPPCPNITLSPSTLPDAAIGVPYEQEFTPTGGEHPYIFRATGNLPPGISLSSSGQLSGTPSIIGSFDFTATATDAYGCSGSQTFTLTIGAAVPTPTPPPSSNLSSQPILLTEENSDRAIALDSVLWTRDPGFMTAQNPFSSDGHSRLMLFALNAELLADETVSAITAQAEDASQTVYPLTVEYVGPVPQHNWLSQMIIKLPDEIKSAKEVRVSITLRSQRSNKVLVKMKP
ncbi:MAG: putative Ig domain-containing protein [Pyrinomonadaceae bacterium]|nr:putative Ig domain-containing protein [Pyrinomonadaceae bacterium]